MSKFIDMSGWKFGRLTVIECAGRNSRNKILWLCQCECGNKIVTMGNYLRNGDTKSCGCYMREVANRPKKHGLKKHPLNQVWSQIKQRCNNPNDKGYSHYGGRGVTICKEWEKDFIKFYNWCIEHGWAKGLEIDRINNNGNYEPGNCRIANRKMQMNNTNSNIVITVDNITGTLKEHCERLGLKYKTIQARITEYGWDANKALKTPIGKWRSSKCAY